MHEIARSLRSAERFLLKPPLPASFAGSEVALCDISAKGVRFRHAVPLETGAKAVLKIAAGAGLPRLDLETIVVWTQPDAGAEDRYVSGARTYGPPAAVETLLVRLRESHRTARIEELRASERFAITPPLEGTFDGEPALIEDLSARGARVATAAQPVAGNVAPIRFRLPETEIEIAVSGRVAWSTVKSINDSGGVRYRAGLAIDERPEMLRLAIGRLCETGRAAIDTHSLALKLKILRARARQLAPSYARLEASGIPAEQYLLIQGVREELRLNPEEAMHWYRRARILIADPRTRLVAPLIASHPDALAVWEYLDRSVDASIVGRAFEL